MAKLQQGENFQEAPIVGVDGQTVNPEEQAEKAKPAGKLNPKTFGIIAVVAVVIIVIFIILLNGKKGETATEDVQTTTETEDDTFAPIDDSLFADSSSNDITEDSFSSDSSTSSAAGDTITDPYKYIRYEDHEVATLRGFGFTGDEIEYASQQGKSFEELVDQAFKDKDEAEAAWRASVLDSASPEYKELLEKTYLGGTQMSTDIEVPDDMRYWRENFNVDYEKLGYWNYQCWLKVEMPYGTNFITVPIDRYKQLPDVGNIVLTVVYYTDADKNILYVASVEEKSIQ